MDALYFTRLISPYDSLLKETKWDEYIAKLCEEGLTWWFNMEIPRIASHLSPLESFPKEFNLPPRLIFLSEAIKSFMSTESLDLLYQTFLQQGDFEAASASAAAEVASIWDSGTDFNRYDPWYQRILDFLERKTLISPLARASLMGFKGFVELTYKCDLSKCARTLKEQLSLAEKAGSNSLKVFHSAVLGHCLNFIEKGDVGSKTT